MPEFLNELLAQQYNEETINKILLGYKSNRKVTLRVNTLKTNAKNIKNILQKFNIEYSEISWTPNALIIENANEKQIE